ncbi:GGDEF domain-containing protein [Dactylosporangium aurantiacum]|uniref:GGDEF domain-containing protein n=1 Tax=Dactylosporangium aurantiacum TaxID=35754 RepID=A0A9Q9I7N0_9ACTN|nr:GGDEF domain-containing protein [Dactylosporangium aurantiacum]MDG6107000.1 GGDEF domain-containing protein [Dactylosporangium aurantiacum]UWZ50641.1 GGDEF domain-containing protein [Dactylosporangium aurantiacum]
MGNGPVIGVLSPFVGGAYYGTILAGISAAASAAGSRTVAVQTLDAAAAMAVNGGTPGFTAPVAWEHLAGFVVLADAVTGTYVDRLRAAGKPVVLLGHTADAAGSPASGGGPPAVVADNGAGIRAAVEHLLGHGHRRIAFTGYVAASDVAERHAAYAGTLRAHGIEPDPALFVPAADNLESGVAWATPQALRDLAATAIVAGTDRNAIGLRRAMAAAGLTGPGDLALTGFDDTEVAAYLTPGLASVRQPLEVMAARAVELLLRAVAGIAVPPGERRIPTVFVPRASCGCDDAALCLPPSGAAAGPQRLAERLSMLLPPGAVRTGEHLAVLAEAVDAVVGAVGAAAAGRTPDPAGATGALLALHGLQARPEGPPIVARAVREYTEQIPAGDVGTARRLDDCVQELIMGVLRVRQVAGFADRWRLRATIGAHYDLSMALLYHRRSDPRDLGWLAVTPASAGALGLWSDGGRLAAQPGWRREPGPPIPAGTLRVSAFPPAELIAAAGPGETVFVVPAKVDASDRGLLAVVGVVECQVEDGRELVNQCAALLTVGLDLREQEERLRRAALCDTLTGLPNRAAFVEHLDRAVRGTERRFAVLFLDLDGFKQVNDRLGHAAGDELLVYVAERIRRSLRAGDMAARFGGDEFVVFLARVGSAEHLHRIAERLRASIEAPYTVGGRLARIGVSIGCTACGDSGSADEILSAADAAMYRVKTAGR